MGTFSIWHWIIVLVVVLVLFGGGGKLTKLMGDAGRGITAFKKGLKEDPKAKAEGDDAEGAEAEVTAQRSITDSEEQSAEEPDKKKASAG